MIPSSTRAYNDFHASESHSRPFHLSMPTKLCVRFFPRTRYEVRDSSDKPREINASIFFLKQPGASIALTIISFRTLIGPIAEELS